MRKSMVRSRIADLSTDFELISKESIQIRFIVFALNSISYFSRLSPEPVCPEQRRRASCLANHFVRPHQHIWRNRQADLLGGFQIDHQLKLRRLLDGQIGGLGSLQDLVDH